MFSISFTLNVSCFCSCKQIFAKVETLLMIFLLNYTMFKIFFFQINWSLFMILPYYPSFIKQQHFLQLWQQLSFHFNHINLSKSITKTFMIFQDTFCLTFNFIQINHFRRQHSKKFVNSYYELSNSDIKQLVLPNRHMVTNYNSHVSVQLPITAAAWATLQHNGWNIPEMV